jgi:ABC-type Fe3+/spermidine/putrescine transport system ATPase subunit
MADQPAIELEAVSVGYQAHKPVLRELSLRVETGQLVAVLGASGSGKSTLLRTIAGLLRPFAGQVKLSGHRVEELPPKARSIGFVFQSLALFPTMTVEGNVQFAAEHANGNKQHRRETVGELLSSLGLTAVAHKFPDQLSGGQAQRVALARALAGAPTTLLLDEPFSSLDRPLADSARELVTQIHAERGLTTILVTHDREQAMLLADRIIVFGANGLLLQDGAPSDVFDHPASAEAASLTGPVSFISGVVVSVNGSTVRVSTDGGQLSARWSDGPPPVLGTPVRVAVRPDWISLHEHSDPAESQINVRVNRAVSVSGRAFLHCSLGRAFLLVENQRVPPPALGSAVTITVNNAIAFPMENGDPREKH